MTAYERPRLPAQVFVDDEGRAYGERWDTPPEESYSVTSHLERFAPLHEVAQALIDHLAENCDVSVAEGAEYGADIMHERDDIVRAVRVTPSAPDAAPLTFVFTSFPSVIVHAGVLHDLLFPVCGCDACDETWQYFADDMERDILAVVAGRFQERVNRNTPPWVSLRVWGADWSRQGGGAAESLDPARLAEARDRLAALSDGRWVAWPQRQPSAGTDGERPPPQQHDQPS